MLQNRVWGLGLLGFLVLGLLGLGFRAFRVFGV